MRKKILKEYRRIGILLLTLVILVSSFIRPLPVYALTQTREVDGAYTYSDTAPGNINYVGGAADYTNLNTPDDGDTTYVSIIGGPSSRATTVWPTQDFVTANNGINSVTTYVRARTQGTADGQLYIACRINGTNYYDTTMHAPSSGGYNTYSYTWTTNPSTGHEWGWSGETAGVNDYNSTSFGFKGYADATRTPYYTTLYVAVDYNPVVVPTVTTSDASGILYDGAHKVTLNGSIGATGGENADFRGFEWGTTSNTTTPASTQSPRTTPYSANWTESGSFGVASFSYQITAGLALCTTYYFRAYAHNSAGWAYGSELSFTTLCDPDITTQAANNIGATTAQLNSLVVNNGGQLADVRFFYSTVSGNCTDNADCTLGTCNGTSYNGTTPWVENTYATGAQPNVIISGLVPSKTYYFCAQIRNDVSCRCGGQLTFTTSSGVAAPTNFKGIPGATTLSLFWVKGTGTTNTLIRYKTNTYPTSITGLDGSTQGYFDTLTSVTVPSLSQGTTYYLRAWGESGGTWSSDNITLMLTTLGTTASSGVVPTPTVAANWFTAPDYTHMSSVPGYDMVNWWADSFEIPRSTLWFMGALFLSLAVGICVYKWGGQKILIADLSVMIMIGLEAAMGLVSLWLILPFLIFAITAVVIGERI